MGQDKPHMEKPLETAWVGLKFGWGQASGNHLGRANSGSQVDGVSNMMPPAGFVALFRVGSENQQWVPPAFLSGRKLPPALTLMPDNLVPPHMSLMPFNLVPLHWSSEVVSPNKCVCWPFKRNFLGFQTFLFSTSSPPLFFTARSYRDLSSWHWNPGLGVLMWGGDPLTPEIPLPVFIYHTQVWDQPILHLCPLLAVSMLFLP